MWHVWLLCGSFVFFAVAGPADKVRATGDTNVRLPGMIARVQMKKTRRKKKLRSSFMERKKRKYVKHRAKSF